MRGTRFAQLTTFAAVAKYNSFTRAAEALGLSTPTLSQAIRNLEEEIGVRLLNRTTRSVALTEAGERLLNHLTPVLDGVDLAIDAISDFRGGPAGTLRLSVHPLAAATIIAPLVARFTASYPLIELEISVDFESGDIVEGRFDAGIHLAVAIARDMIAVPIGGRLDVRTVAAPEYLSCNSVPESLEELLRHNCIRYRWSADKTADAWKFRHRNADVEVEVDGSLTANDLEIALRAALDGVGVVQLPECVVAPHLADGQLVSLLTEHAPVWSDFLLYYPSRRQLPTKLRAMIDFLKSSAHKR